MESISKIVETSTAAILNKKFGKSEKHLIFVKELINYKKCQIENIFNLEKNKTAIFSFNIPKFLNEKKVKQILLILIVINLIHHKILNLN